jgi:hypothetical protein
MFIELRFERSDLSAICRARRALGFEAYAPTRPLGFRPPSKRAVQLGAREEGVRANLPLEAARVAP